MFPAFGLWWNFNVAEQEPVCFVCQIITSNYMFSEWEHGEFLGFCYATPSPNQAASELRRRSREVNTFFIKSKGSKFEEDLD